MIHTVNIKILDNRLNEHGLDYATEGSAAIDVRACVNANVKLRPGDVKLIGLGFAMDIRNPEVAAMLLPRSGLGHKNGIVLGNLTGLIDSDYQGEVFASVWNRSNRYVTIEPMQRIAQMIFVPVVRVDLNPITGNFLPTNRGEGGFGSTGT
jgi:dUTP pyrophosphatase